jgi:hydroxyethylthiazole kinase
MSVSAPLAAIQAQHPLLHCISNIVSANDCANLALAIGASPIMAQAPQEMADIAALASAVVLNTGTPDAEKFRACRICAVSARHPVVLDPVGVGASPWRLGQVRALLDLFTPSILRVNLGEARALLEEWGEAGAASTEKALEGIRSAMTEEELEIYDPLEAYRQLVDWLE